MTEYLLTIVDVLGSLSVLIVSIYAFMVYRIHRHSYWVWFTTAIACVFAASAVSTYPFSSAVNVPWIMIPLAVFALFGGISFLIAARKLLADVTPSAAAAAAGAEETALLRDDILAVRGYAALTNMFLATAKSAIGDKLLKDVLTEHFEYNPILFEDCEIKDDGAITTESIVKNLDGIHGENRVGLVCSMFSALNTKIMNLYGAVTSPDLAEKALGVSYLTVKKQYGDLPVFFDILRSLPEGVLEEARISLLSRKELEVRVREITATLEKAYQKLVKTEAADRKKAAFIESMPDSVIMLDLDGKVISLNPAYTRMFGWKPEDRIGKSFTEFKSLKAEDIERFMKLLGKLVETGHVESIETLIRTKDGREIPISVAYSLIKDAEGNPKNIIAVLRDITELKHVEEERVKAVSAAVAAADKARAEEAEKISKNLKNTG